MCKALKIILNIMAVVTTWFLDFNGRFFQTSKLCPSSVSFHVNCPQHFSYSSLSIFCRIFSIVQNSVFWNLQYFPSGMLAQTNIATTKYHHEPDYFLLGHKLVFPQFIDLAPELIILFCQSKGLTRQRPGVHSLFRPAGVALKTHFFHGHRCAPDPDHLLSKCTGGAGEVTVDCIYNPVPAPSILCH